MEIGYGYYLSLHCRSLIVASLRGHLFQLLNFRDEEIIKGNDSNHIEKIWYNKFGIWIFVWLIFLRILNSYILHTCYIISNLVKKIVT